MAAGIDGEPPEGTGHAGTRRVVQSETAADGVLHKVRDRRSQSQAGVPGAQGEGGIPGDAAAVRRFDLPDMIKAFTNGRVLQGGA